MEKVDYSLGPEAACAHIIGSSSKPQIQTETGHSALAFGQFSHTVEKNRERGAGEGRTGQSGRLVMRAGLKTVTISFPNRVVVCRGGAEYSGRPAGSLG